ncbi:MAG: 6-pyruvoyl-tetrahydropterin synthase-related protein, partial [Desulfocucumaceae bacterium]
MNREERKENVYFEKEVQKKQFRFELLTCSVILATAIIFSMWPVFSAPSNVYPATVDGMGHLTKVKYIADCFKELKWPSWFPYWYNGATVMQYYPPLSYLLLAPIQMIFDNVMITFKFFLFSTQFIGSLGVWYFCHRFIGSWVGIVGGLLYALQPFLLRSLLLSGVVAQGPIYALTPWLLVLTLLFIDKIMPLRWLSVSVALGLLT